MPWARWIVATLLFIDAGWMAFDGSRALIVGDYITPKSGPHAGQYGPWQHPVRAVGIDPRSTLMKWVFVTLGAAGLACCVGVAAGAPWAWWGTLAFVVASAWYLPFGTLISLVVFAMLMAAPSLRALQTG